jgi:hypothetical protein
LKRRPETIAVAGFEGSGALETNRAPRFRVDIDPPHRVTFRITSASERSYPLASAGVGSVVAARRDSIHAATAAFVAIHRRPMRDAARSPERQASRNARDVTPGGGAADE